MGERKGAYRVFRWRRERDNVEDIGVDGLDNVKMNLQHVGLGHGWIDLAQDRDRWRAVVKIGVP